MNTITNIAFKKMAAWMVVVLMLSSCSNTKYLKDGELLYTGAKVVVEEGKKVKGRKSITNKTATVIQPEPNKKFLGMKIGLWFYNVAGEPKKKGFRYFVKNKLGQPPVLFQQVDPNKVRDHIDATLFNNGYFRSYSNFQLKNKGKKVSIEYQLFLTEPYVVDSVLFESGEFEILSTIQESLKETTIRRGDVYSLEVIKAEKIRIDGFLKTRGFFYFQPDYLIFEADTTGGNRKMNLKLTIREITPYEALLVYRINDVYINTNYTVGDDSVSYSQDTIAGRPFFYHSENNHFRKRTIVRSVFLDKGEIYSRKDHNATLGQLMGMGTFKFVNVRFTEEDSLNVGFITSFINLTPLPRRSMQLELELKSKSNNFVGPGFRVSYRNRNSFKGAELFVLNLHTSFETQLGKNAKGFNSFEIGPEVELYFPRFITPFNIRNPSGYYVPKTKITAGYNYLTRADFFNLTSFTFTYGYKWKETQLKDHELNPVVLNYVRLSNKSDEFNQLLQDNLLLQKSFEEQFIVGMNYLFSYNEQLVPKKVNQFYFQGKMELSGNTVSLLNQLFQSEKPNPDAPYELAGEVYAQYARFETDFRNYYNIGKTTQLIARIYGGIGIAYGNSSTLPFISQFFSGGSSSVRAFRVRSLGPGTYRNEDNQTSFYDQGGDIKLEGNLEYRYKIAGMFRGAFFVDAGNIWLLKENPSTPGGKFSNNFLNELGIGGGFGLRLDANFFVLRLDLAMPFKKPWLQNDATDVQPGDGSWRKDNLLLNIAIGYPF
ncbi:MAG: BamA/TamA family outer membrane protein [Bacteroidota bacterium]|nr:BamA/TamA family outer membrane protein [Bacteroidota bacterium]